MWKQNGLPARALFGLCIVTDLRSSSEVQSPQMNLYITQALLERENGGGPATVSQGDDSQCTRAQG